MVHYKIDWNENLLFLIIMDNQLYYDNAKKIETKIYGVDVTGTTPLMVL